MFFSFFFFLFSFFTGHRLSHDSCTSNETRGRASLTIGHKRERERINYWSFLLFLFFVFLNHFPAVLSRESWVRERWQCRAEGNTGVNPEMKSALSSSSFSYPISVSPQFCSFISLSLFSLSFYHICFHKHM